MLAVAAALMLRVFAALALLALASLVGHALLPRPACPAHARERLPLGLAFGVLLIGWGVWLLGSILGTWTAAPLFALLVLLAAPRAPRWWADVRRVGDELALLARAAPVAALLALVPAALVVPLLAAPLWDSDGIRYHVAFPKLFLLTGRVFLYPYDVTGAFPQTTEMLNMLLLPFTGGEGAKALHAGFFLAVCATLVLTVHRSRRTRAAALLAPLLYAAAPVVLVSVPAGFIEQAAVFPIAVGALLVARRRAPAGIGLALAAAVLTKWTVLPAVAGLGVVALARAPRGALRRSALALALPAALFFAPLGIRNVLATGDPFFPAGHGLLGKPIPNVPPDRLSWATRYHGDVALPLGIRWISGEPGVRDEVAGVHHLVGLFALLLAVRERRLRPFLALLVPYLLLSLPFRPPTRYLVPGFLALAVFEAEVLARLDRRVALGLAALATLPALAASASLLLSGPAVPYVRGRLDRSGFLAAAIPGWRAAALVNRLPPGGRVMALDFPGPYYFDRPWIAEGVLTEPPIRRWLREEPSAEGVLRRLASLDVRYLVVTPGYGGGTGASLFPLATSRESAAALVALRSQLRLAGRVDGVDVWEVPR